MASVDTESFPVGLTTALYLLILSPLLYYIYLAAVYVKKVETIGKAVDQLPGPKKHWLFGNLDQFPGPNEAGLRWMQDEAKKHNTCFRFWLGPLNCGVHVFHPKLIKQILFSTQPKQLDGFYKMIVPWIGDGLPLSSGSKWRRNRRLLTPAFHLDILKSYIQIYNEAADIFMDKLEKASKSGSVEISRPITLLTLNIILRCAFSSDADVQRQGQYNSYANAVIELKPLLIERSLNPFLHVDLFYSLSRTGRLTRKYLKVVHGASEDVIAKRKIVLRDNPEEGKQRHSDFLDILLLARDENDQGLSDREIRDEVDTFLFAGHDTTASTLMWVLYDLARHPNHQQTCREEIDQFLEKREIKTTEWDDLAELPFTTQCMKESMRLHSPVPIISRQVENDFELDGVKLLPGTFINIHLFLCHHNEEFWGPDHDDFKPERFDPDRVEQLDSFAFLLFSAGPRNCIGQNLAVHEIKVVVSRVLNRFDLAVDENHKVERKPEIVTGVAHGIKLFIKPRVK